MTLVAKSLENLLTKLQISNENIEYVHLITVANQAYLKIVINELENLKKKENKVINFDFLMRIYNKHIKEHQVMFLLFNIFETAIRSKAVTILSEKYSSPNEDNWLHSQEKIPSKIQRPWDEAIKKMKQDNEDIKDVDSFIIFDYIMLGQLKAIYFDFWSDLSYLFDEKNVNGHKLSKIGKRKFKEMFDDIRKARNDNAHHKPLHNTRKRRHQIIAFIEIILVHIGFNLDDAINNIDPFHKIIILKYQRNS